MPAPLMPLLAGCASVSPNSSPPAALAILPYERKRQPTIPLGVLADVLKGWALNRERWLNMLTRRE
jgi:hypothetical protein